VNEPAHQPPDVQLSDVQVSEDPHRTHDGHGRLHERVGIVVVTHAGAGPMLTRCIDAVAATTHSRVVVVDNSGHDDRRETRGDDLPGSPSVVTRRRCANRGFGAAANVGFGDATIATTDYVMLLNDDVTVGDGWLEPLVSALDGDPKLGAVQPKLLLAGTDPVLINSLGVTIDRYGAGSDLGYRTPDAVAASGRPVDDPASVVSPIEMFTGGAVLLRRAFLDEVGGFDERYFLYYEDVDLALRGAERGWRYACVSASVVEHEMGATTASLDDGGRALQERNRLVTVARFGTWPMLGRAWWLSVRRLRHEPTAAHRRALLGGLARLPRALVERARRHRGRGA
jgi:N-acetylglucosaminyl-diphospho-decaprenol L-rhamnosyltransferase